jgi:hypothetical protein
MYGCMCVCVWMCYVWMNGCVDVWMDGWMDGCVYDGCMYVCVCMYIYVCVCTRNPVFVYVYVV